ncbi:MAG: phosphatidate cytidylyltransferase [Thermoleophilia bacterium]|nr:phosphatidate cytidylyltransferase [Thermoleophilia bacterium]
MSNVLSRLAVAAAGLPIVLGAAYAGGWWLAALVCVAGVLALDELYRAGKQLRALTLAGFAGLLATLVGTHAGGAGWLAGGVFLTLPLAFVFVLFAETRQTATVSLSFTVLGVVWLGLGLGHLVLLRAIPQHGRDALIALLLAVFATDTCAYAVGKLVGRRKLAPAVSPGKSWEGFVGGAIGGVFVTWVWLYPIEGFVEQWQALVLGAAIVLASTAGDLLESLFKRNVGVKDTGALLAGHGGVLDRIDSLLFAGPAAYYVLVALDAAPL